MPTGMFLCSWNDKIGVVIQGMYPEHLDLPFNDEELMKIFISHITSERAGTLVTNIEKIKHDDPMIIFTTHFTSEKTNKSSLSIKKPKIYSYYNGPPETEKNNQYLVFIILEDKEEPMFYEEFFTEISQNIISDFDYNPSNHDFEEDFSKIKYFASLSPEEQKIIGKKIKIRERLVKYLRKETNGSGLLLLQQIASRLVTNKIEDCADEIDRILHES